MSTVPTELPLKASEAAALCQVILEQIDGREPTGESRALIATRIAELNLNTIRAYPGSLEMDPAHPSTYYLAIDALTETRRVPLLIHVTPASSPAAPLFSNAVSIGRVRPGGEREMLVNAIPFASTDHEQIRRFVLELDRSLLPRPQGAQPAIAAGNRHPEISLPAAFQAFEKILDETGINLASTVQLSATREMTTEEALANRDGENPVSAGHTRVSIRHLYHAGLWAAIRCGFRHGYNAEADHIIITGDNDSQIAQSVEVGKEAIRHASGYTKFTTDTSRLFELQADTRHPDPWPDSVVRERYEQIFDSGERSWIEQEFAAAFDTGETSYVLRREEIVRLAVKFGRSLKLNEELYDYIQQVKEQEPARRTFDFEPSLDEADTLTTPQELIFYMHWLKVRGRAAQLVPPNLGFKKRQAYPMAIKTGPESGVGLEDYVQHKMWPELLPRVMGEYGGKPLEELAARVSLLAAVARRFNGTLSVHSGSGKQAEVLEHIGRSTAGRVNYKISGELQLQLFDVLSEQPAGSRWRQLYERMADRCNRFAEQGAFGAESELAAKYLEMGRGYYLGNAAAGRVDGNLFLVFWAGNMVGTRDTAAPDGDHRFFKEKIDELPEELVQEVQRRNAEYIVWLARHLKG